MKNRQTNTAVLIVVTVATLLSTVAVRADKPTDIPKQNIELGAPFRDNAILQREMPVPVWGWTQPGKRVTVQFADQKKTATAGKDGKWMAELGKLKARMIMNGHFSRFETPGQSRGGPGAKEWRLTLPAMKASTVPKTLKVEFLIDGEVVHERVSKTSS